MQMSYAFDQNINISNNSKKKHIPKEILIYTKAFEQVVGAKSHIETGCCRCHVTRESCLSPHPPTPHPQTPSSPFAPSPHPPPSPSPSLLPSRLHRIATVLGLLILKRVVVVRWSMMPYRRSEIGLIRIFKI